MRNFTPLKTPGKPKEWDKAPSQPIGWNPGRRQWKMITDNSRTQISGPNPGNVEKKNSFFCGVGLTPPLGPFFRSPRFKLKRPDQR
jgi:hypothetical protein